MIIPYALILGWTIFSIFYIYRVWSKKDANSIIPYVYNSIPTVFTTLGVLGTFIGIYYGLIRFDVNKITESIPTLLEGMKTAFLTSIIGIILSLVAGKISQIVLKLVENTSPARPTDELAALQEMTLILRSTQEQNETNFTTLNHSLIGDGDDSVSTQLVKLRNQFTELELKQTRQVDALNSIQSALGGDGETSLLTQMQKMRAEQNDYSKDNKRNIDSIIESMKANNELITRKFDEFSELLAKNNTEALVDVMKKATEQFNAQMAELIDKLVKENFQELNNSVQNLNQWQKENKEMISALTDQFRKVSNEFEISAVAIKEITTNTTQLTNDNSHLTRLIAELQKVMVDDTKFERIIGKLSETVDMLENNTKAFDQTTEKLNVWVRNQMDFRDSVAKLLSRLEEIDKIKDINEVFWENTKKQLNEGVSVIRNSSKLLSDDLEKINAEFYERLNDTLQNLDRLIQRIILEHKK
jgi:hypothetical protein